MPAVSTKLYRTYYYHIRDLQRIRQHLLLCVVNIIATALVASKLDYCNSLFQNIAFKDIKTLQRVQHCLQ